MPRRFLNRFTLTLALYLCFVVVLAVSWGLYDKQRVLDDIDGNLSVAAKALKFMLADDFHDRATGPESISREEELQNRTRFNAFVRENLLVYAYTLVTRDGVFYFAAPTVTEEEAQAQESWYFHPYPDIPGEFVVAYAQGQDAVLSYSDQWGTFRTYCAFETSPGGTPFLACADVEITAVNRINLRHMVIIVAASLGFMAFVIPLVVMTRRFYRDYTRDIEAANQQLLEHQQNLRQTIAERTRALRQAKDEAERATQMKSRFLAQMSHEIRTPLSSVVGLTDLLTRTRLDPEQQRLVQGLGSASDLLLGLVSDVLDFSRIEQGRLTLDQTAFRPATVLKNVERLFADLAHQKLLGLHFHLAPELPELVLGDPLRYQQILVNLVGNALKYTRQGRVDVRVRPLSVDQDTVVVEHRVIDTGVGIGAYEVDKLFESFSQADSARTVSARGSGLGLNIVKGLLSLMGGGISVQSEPGKGSTFTFIIPFARAGAEVGEEPVEDNGTCLLPPCRLLVAEDNEPVVELFRLYFADCPVLADYAANGAEAVEFFAHNRYDVVILDIEMPLMDGIGAARVMRGIEAHREGPRTPIMGLSAIAGKDVMDICGQTFFDTYLTKPVKKAFLFRHLAQLMGREAPPPLSQGDFQDSIRELILPFLEKAQTMVTEMHRQTASGDLAGLKRLAHSLKGSGLSYGFETVGNLAKALEEAAAREDTAPMAELLESLEVAVRQALQEERQRTPDSGGDGAAT